MNLQDAQARIEELEAEIAEMKQAKVNPVYTELLNHLVEGPKTISELAELMVRENRTISQWLHAVKVKYGANIITLADGKKQLMNPEDFQHS